ncbi:hypothetical protein D9M73_182540 [compost metagenome]
MANFSPRFGTDFGVDAAIGHDFHRSISEQQIDQQSVVVLGIPYAQLSEKFDSPIFGRLSPEKWHAIQCPFDHEPDLSSMRGLAGFDCRLDRVQRASGKGSCDLTVCRQQVLQDA